MLIFHPFSAMLRTATAMLEALLPGTRRTMTLFLALFFLVPLAARGEVLDRIVAVVNDGIVLQSDLDQEMEFTLIQLRARGINAPDPELLRSQVLEKLILTRIQMQRADQAGIRVDDRELNEVLSRLARQNNMSLSEFAAAIRADGGDYLAIRDKVREDVITSRLRQREVEGRVLVTDQDIDLYLSGQADKDASTEFQLSHILIAVPDGATPEQREQARLEAESLRTELEEGAAFAELAVSHSDGQQALSGGDLGWRTGDKLPLNFLRTAQGMNPGDVSEVLETSGGFHLIQLVGTRGGEERQSVTETLARHILLKPDTLRDENQSRLLARDLHDRIEKGEDLGKLATRYSDDPGSKNNEGKLGWQPPGVFVPEFQEVVDRLEPEGVSEPFRSPFGWHIVQVLDRRTRDVTQEARRAQARGVIHNRKAAEEFETWLRRLRSEAYVEYRGTGSASLAEQGDVSRS